MIFITVFTLDGHRLKRIIFDSRLVNRKFVFIEYFFKSTTLFGFSSISTLFPQTLH